jgi:hypothetical protein
MFALVLQIFLWKQHLVKNWLVSTLDKVSYVLQKNNFSGVYKNLFSLHEICMYVGGVSAEKRSFFQKRFKRSS